MAEHLKELRKFSDTQTNKDPLLCEDGTKETNPLILEFEQLLLADSELRLVMAIQGHPPSFQRDPSRPVSPLTQRGVSPGTLWYQANGANGVNYDGVLQTMPWLRQLFGCSQSPTLVRTIPMIRCSAFTRHWS
jgi:hypothetical protein